MQDMTPEACSQAPLNTQKILADVRDGNTYTIARIKNQTNDTALCWMTQNLRIVGDRTLTSDDSDVEDNFFLPASTILDSSGDNPKQFYTNDQYQSKVYYTTDISNGAYYNWYTATAGIGNSTVTSNGDNANHSICPKGWRLPTGGSGGELNELLNKLSANVITAAPYNFVYNGFINASIISYVNERGCYWSSTVNSTSTAFTLFFASGSVTPHNTNSRYYGYSVRCVAR